MIKKILLFILGLSISFIIHAEEINFEWNENIAPSISNGLGESKMMTTSDGGAIVIFNTAEKEVLGLTNSGSYDSIIAKYNKEGSIVWTKKIGDEYSDFLYDFVITDTDEIVAVGSSNVDFEPDDNEYLSGAIIVKYDKDGNIIWQKNWGKEMQISSHWIVDSAFNLVLLTKDNEYIALGINECISTPISYRDEIDTTCTDKQIMVKYDKDGNIIWQKSWNDNEIDGSITKAKMLSDGSFIVAGTMSKDDDNSKDIHVYKFDKEGNILWKSSWGGKYNENLNDMSVMNDGTIVLKIKTSSPEINGIPTKFENGIVKVSATGEIISWETALAYGPLTETDNYYWLTGINIEDYDYEIPEIFIKKYDKTWQLKQTITSGKINDGIFEYEYITSLIPLKNDNILAMGFKAETSIETDETKQKELILKYDSDLNVIQEKVSENMITEEDYVNKKVLKNGNSLYFLDALNEPTLEGHEKLVIKKYTILYEIVSKETNNGIFETSKRASKGIINLTPNEGYEVDEIIVRDSKDRKIEVVLQTDGTYEFELYDDVTVEVTFKEKIENPKTGIIDLMTILFVGIFMSLSGFFIVKKYNERLEL